MNFQRSNWSPIFRRADKDATSRSLLLLAAEDDKAKQVTGRQGWDGTQRAVVRTIPFFCNPRKEWTGFILIMSMNSKNSNNDAAAEILPIAQLPLIFTVGFSCVDFLVLVLLNVLGCLELATIMMKIQQML